MKIQSTGQNFNGIKIASARAKLDGAVSTYELYRITDKDTKYLDNLVSNTDLKKLYPGLKDFDYYCWEKALKGMLNYSRKRFETLLISKNGIPCGALNYSRSIQNTCDVGYRVTWPDKTGQKAVFAGKILYLNLFKECLSQGVRSIKTIVNRVGPFDAIAKCYQLGFCFNGGDNSVEIMGIGQKGMKTSLEKFKDNIEIIPEPEETQQDIDLSEILKS